MGLADRAELLKGRQPDLVADIMLYAIEEGGRRVPVPPGYGCVCVVSKNIPLQGYDVLLQLEDDALCPGQQRRLGLVFLTPEGARAVRNAAKFFLWEGRFIGEGSVGIEG